MGVASISTGQGIFEARYGNNPDDFIDQFASMEYDYIWEWIERQDGFPNEIGLYDYMEAYKWFASKYGAENVSGYIEDMVKVFVGVDKLEVG